MSMKKNGRAYGKRSFTKISPREKPNWARLSLLGEIRDLVEIAFCGRERGEKSYLPFLIPPGMQRLQNLVSWVIHEGISLGLRSLRSYFRNGHFIRLLGEILETLCHMSATPIETNVLFSQLGSTTRTYSSKLVYVHRYGPGLQSLFPELP